MKAYDVIVDDQAIHDIERNANWWAEHHSAQQAEQWFELAFDCVESLATLPGRHPLSVENNDFPFEIRHLLFGLGARPSYRIVFTIQERTVHVLAVRRGSQGTLRPTDVGFSGE